MNNDNGQDQGNSGSQSFDNPDLGNQNAETNQTENPSGQDGQQTDPRDADLAKYKAETQRLNKALIEARRGQRQHPQNQGDGQSPFETPEGQYAISLEVATGQLSRKLEDIYDLYPEVSASEMARIRKNPWAFASFESYRAGDVDTAMLEVEYALLQRAQELEGQNQNNGQAGHKTIPANINPNQPKEQAADAVPGTTEDENPWTMPMDKLEQKAKKQLAQSQTKS